MGERRGGGEKMRMEVGEQRLRLNPQIYSSKRLTSIELTDPTPSRASSSSAMASIW
jgi:hypothetical protein